MKTEIKQNKINKTMNQTNKETDSKRNRSQRRARKCRTLLPTQSLDQGVFQPILSCSSGSPNPEAACGLHTTLH